MNLLDETHDPALRSWVPSANEPGTDFPVQNLPFARFRRRGSDAEWRVGVAIGDQILDLRLAAAQCPWGDGIHTLLGPLADGDLGGFIGLGRGAWRAVRQALSMALAEGSDQGPFLELCLVPQRLAEYAMPCFVHDYTSFNAGIHHVATIGRLSRPDLPLLPNYKWLPIAHHGRASTLSLGGQVRRPRGQVRAAVGADPVYAPSRRLDYELELGALVGTGNRPGEPIPIERADEHLFGLVLLNDWTARDLQSWEHHPLGPFLAKSFATHLSPWVVTLDALAPFRRPAVRPAGDPALLPYLDSPFNREAGAFDIGLEAWLQTSRMARAERVSRSNALDAYWTLAQLVAHHTSNGCNLQTGDLLGTGALSGPGPGQGASLVELTLAGRQPLQLPGGEQRVYLEDGDTVTLRARCEAPDAAAIGFGPLVGRVAG
jgi:fumarylacetoacetase